MNKTAILLGATGLTGGELLSLLLADNRFDRIKIFSRSPVSTSHPKIEEHLVNLLQLQKYKEQFTGDVVFCCIGTTKAKTPDKEQYHQIDFGIPVTAAKLAEENAIPKFIVISALGADPNSKIFYNRVKGEMEAAVLALSIEHPFILQPALIGGNRNEKRRGEQIAQWFFATFSFLVPQKYKMIAPRTIAKAMVFLAHATYERTRIPSDEIKKLARQ